MKIKDCNAAALTNFDVLDFLRCRGAANPTRVLVSVVFKVYDYLTQTAACDQSRENIFTFMEKCKECKNKLAEAELLNIVNIRPSTAVEIDPIIEQCDARFPHEELLPPLLKLIEAVLPPGPSKPEPEEDGNQMESD